MFGHCSSFPHDCVELVRIYCGTGARADSVRIRRGFGADSVRIYSPCGVCAVSVRMRADMVRIWCGVTV